MLTTPPFNQPNRTETGSLSQMNERMNETTPTPPGQSQVRYQLPTGTPPYSVAESWFGVKLAWGIHNMIRRPTFFDLGTYSSAPCPRLTKVVKTTLKERKKRKRKENRIIHCAEITFFSNCALKLLFLDIQIPIPKFGAGLKY